MVERGEKRNKRKGKLQEKKKHPYKSGGIFRTGEVQLRISEKAQKKKN